MLTWRFLLRDWRSGELRLLAVSLMLAIAMVVAIASFSERLQKAIGDQSSQFIAADRVLVSPYPVDPSWLERARQAGLATAQTISFQTMLFANDHLELASIKAVSQAYPLKGEVRIQALMDGTTISALAAPQGSEAWLDSRLFTLLDIKLGDSLEIGDSVFTASAILVAEPDSASGFSALSPKVMISDEKLESMGVIQPGSRVNYRYLFAGDAELLDSYRQWLTALLSSNQRWQSVKSGSSSVAQAIRRAEVFLLLGGAIAVLLAGVAVALTAHQYSGRHRQYVAIMKALGARRSQIDRLYTGQLALLFVAAALVGGLLGTGLQVVFSALAARMFAMDLPSSGPWPLALGAITGLVCLIAYALPPLWRLHTVTPLTVLRLSTADMPTVLPQGGGVSLLRKLIYYLRSSMTYLLGGAGIFLLMVLYSGSVKLSLGLLLGLVLIACVLGVAAFVLIRFTRSVGMQAKGSLRLALANIQRRIWSNSAQVLIFSFALMLLLLLVTTRTSLIDDWQQQIPDKAPNHFLINISKAQTLELEAYFKAEDIHFAGLYPMVRGRLSDINGVDIKLLVDESMRSRAGVNRELNLSWSVDLPKDNRLTAGLWWPDLPAAADLPGVSLEAVMAERLGIEVGDQLRLVIGGLPLEARVTSLRSLRWDRMTPNFYMLFEPDALLDYSATYITSIYVPAEKQSLLTGLSRQFPSITILDTRAIIGQVRQIVGQVSAAIEVVSVMIVVAATLVILAAVLASSKTRIHEYTLLRTLGASRGLIIGSIWLEFLVLGAMAGLLAAMGAELAVYSLQTQVFQLDARLHWELWFGGPILGAVIIASMAYLACRKVVLVPPSEIMRMN
jgi:putative ABC transport system permease protein